MSSQPVTSLLQVVAPSADTRPQQSNSSPDGQFQDLLADASSAIEKQSKQDAESTAVQPSDEPVTENSEQDASAQYDESATPDATSDTQSEDTAESPDVPDDGQADAVELSEAVELLLSTQVVPEKILTAEAAPQPALESSVIDAPSVENYENQGDEPQPQATTEQFVKSGEVDVAVLPDEVLPEEAAVATQQPVVVETSEGTEARPQEGAELPARERVIESDQRPATGDAGEDHSEQATEAERQPPTDAVGKPVTQTAEVSVAEETQAPEEAIERETRPRESKETQASESSQLKPEPMVGAEEPVDVAKDSTPVHASSSTPTAAHAAGDEAVGAASRTPTGSTDQTLAASNADAESDPVPTADRARFVQRVGRAFQKAQSQDGQIQLRLSPPELGTLKISITVQEGVVSAKVEAETAAARNILLDNLPALRDRLAEQDIRIEKFDVDVFQEGGQETDNSGADEREARQLQADATALRRELDSESLETTSSTSNPQPLGTVTEGGLDVRV